MLGKASEEIPRNVGNGVDTVPPPVYVYCMDITTEHNHRNTTITVTNDEDGITEVTVADSFRTATFERGMTTIVRNDTGAEATGTAWDDACGEAWSDLAAAVAAGAVPAAVMQWVRDNS